MKSHNQFNASITVLLSLISFLILACITTTLESTRINSAKNYAYGILHTASSSVLAHFNRSLYDRYHIFGLDAGFGTSFFQQDKLEQLLLEPLTNMISPLNGKPNFGIFPSNSFLIWNFKQPSCSISDIKTLFDFDGELFAQEAIDYMKFKEVSNLGESLLPFLQQWKETETTVDLLEEKIKTEEQFIEIDKDLLELFKRIDGIQFDGGSFDFSTPFLKQIVLEEPTPFNVGIQNPELFSKISPFYYNISAEIDNLIENESTKEERKQWNEYRENFTVELQNLSEDTLTFISSIQGKQKKLLPSVQSFEKQLEEKGEFIEPSLQEELNSSLNDMKAYSGIYSNNKQFPYNFSLMQETLEHNKKVLSKALSYDASLLLSDNREISKKILQELKQIYEEYSYEHLFFDYSKWKLPAEKNSLWETIQNLFSSGILELVIENTDTLSEAILNDTSLPSQGKDLKKKNCSSDFLTSKEEELLPSLFDSASFSFSKDLLSDLGKEFLFLEYLKEHFSNYTKTQRNFNQILQYELEYILEGNNKDKENIASIALQLFLLRALFNMVFTISNSTMVSKATAIATLLVGFTGLPFLIQLVKYLILVLWSMEQALVETAALFLGKKVSFFPSKSSFCVDLSELLTMNKYKIIEKAKNYTAFTKTIDYSTYLFLFLFLQDPIEQRFFSLDLIQENLKEIDKTEYLLQNFIFGFCTDVSLELPVMFINLSFLTGQKIKSIKGYGYSLKHSVSY